MDFRYRILGYGLPFMLWPAELFIRSAMGSPDAAAFFPPSLAAAALGLLVPSLSERHVRRDDNEALELQCARKNENIRYFSTMLLLLGILTWLANVYLGVGGKWPFDWPIVRERIAEWMASILYGMVVMLNEWRVHHGTR